MEPVAEGFVAVEGRKDRSQRPEGRQTIEARKVGQIGFTEDTG